MRSEEEIRGRLKVLREQAKKYPRLSIYVIRIDVLLWVLKEVPE